MADMMINNATSFTGSPGLSDTPRSLSGMGSPPPPDSRPASSSLSKYKPLPAIGSAKSDSRTAAPQSSGQGQIESPLSPSSSAGQPSPLARQMNMAYQIPEVDSKDGKESQNLSNNNFGTAETTLTDSPVINPAPSQTTQGQTSQVPPSDSLAQNSPELMYKKLTRNVDLTTEPSPGEPSIVLAIKLPTGARVQRNFRLTDTLEMVLNFAEVSAQLDFTGVEMVCDIPRQVFKDLKVNLTDSGLQNRTVLHVQLPEDKAA